MPVSRRESGHGRGVEQHRVAAGRQQVAGTRADKSLQAPGGRHVVERDGKQLRASLVEGAQRQRFVAERRVRRKPGR